MAKNITIYSSDSCGYCTLAKNYLRDKGVAFVEKNLGTDPAALEEFRKMNMSGVPVLIIDGETVIGFDKAKIDSLI